MKRLFLATLLFLFPAAVRAQNFYGLPPLNPTTHGALSYSIGSDSVPNIGTDTDPACASPSSTCSLISINKAFWAASLNEPIVKLDASNIPLPTLPPSSGVPQDASVTAAGVVVSFGTANYNSVVHTFKQVGAGNTITFEESPDNGVSDWSPLSCFELDTAVSQPASSFALTTTTPTFACPAHLPYQRSRVSTYGSGTVEDYAVPTAMQAGLYVQGATSNGGIYLNGNNIPALAQGGTTSQAPTNTAGSRFVTSEGRVATYAATFSGTPAANPTDILTLYGTNSLPVHLKSITIQATATSAGSMIFGFARRSSATSGGTSSTITGVKQSPNDANSAATLTVYSANPTVGGGNVFQDVVVPFCVSTAPCSPITIKYGDNNDQSFQTSLAGNEFAINLGGVALPAGAVITITLRWTEEND